MINDKITNSGKTILDIFEDFYEKHKKDRALIDKLIEVFDLLGTDPEAISGFLNDNAKILDSLVGARQKTTKDLLDMLSIAAKFQQNELSANEKEDDVSSWMETDKDFDEDIDDEVEDLLKTVAEESEEESVKEKVANGLKLVAQSRKSNEKE